MNLTRPLVFTMAAGLAASVAIELLGLDRAGLHAPVPYGDVPGFWAGFGFVWCVIIVTVSKWLGHTFLMRHGDPYTGGPIDGSLPPRDLGRGASHPNPKPPPKGSGQVPPPRERGQNSAGDHEELHE